MDNTAMKYLRQRNLEWSSIGGRILMCIGILILAETAIFLRFIQLGLVIHVAVVFVLFWLIYATDELIKAYEALVFVPLLRLLNFGTVAISGHPFAWLAGVYLLVLLGLSLLLHGYGFGPWMIGLDRITRPIDWLLILTGIVVGIILGSIQWALNLEAALAEPTLRNVVLIVLVTGLLVGFVEEILFRGLLQPWVAEFTGTSVSVVAVSVLFGFMHSVWLNPLDIVFAFCVSLLLGGVYARTRNFWFIASVHSLINITAFAVLPLLLGA